MIPRPLWITTLYGNQYRTGPGVLVMVYANRAQMHAGRRAWRKRVTTSQFRPGGVTRRAEGAAMWSWQRIPRLNKRVRGIVWLHQGYFGPGVVSREMTHIVTYARLIRRTETFSQWSERLAWMQGELVKNFWFKFWRSPIAPAGAP